MQVIQKENKLFKKNIQIDLNVRPLSQITHTKFLGILIDNKYERNTYVDYIKKRYQRTPLSIQNVFITNAEVHNYSTRKRSQFRN